MPTMATPTSPEPQAKRRLPLDQALRAIEVGDLSDEVVDGLCDEVGDVVIAAAGHGDVRRCGASGLTEREVSGFDGLALRSVGGGGEGQFDVLTDVLRRQRALARPASDQDAAVVADPDHGPGVTVGDVEVAVVAPGRDSVA